MINLVKKAVNFYFRRYSEIYEYFEDPIFINQNI